MESSMDVDHVDQQTTTECTTPPGTANADHMSFGSSPSLPEQLQASSPERRQRVYYRMCTNILRRMAELDEGEVFRQPFVAFLKFLFRPETHQDKQDSVALAQAVSRILEASDFLKMASQEIEPGANHLHITVARQLLAGSKLNPPRDTSLIINRIQSCLDRGLRPESNQDRLATFLESALGPDQFRPTRGALSFVFNVQRAFTSKFQGPAVDRFLFHLAVLSSNSFPSARAPASDVSSPAMIPAASWPHSFTAAPRPESGYLRQVGLPYYARVVPILQSSGFGKSKLCVHLSARHAGLLTCVREQSPSQVQSFPPQDPLVYEYFQHTRLLLGDDSAKPIDGQRDLNAHARVACFLAAYCQTLYSYLQNLMRLSECFRVEVIPFSSSPSSQTLVPVHDDPSCCWDTLVYALSVSLHQKPGFLDGLELDPPSHMCRHSQLHAYRLVPSSQTASSSSASIATPTLSPPTKDLSTILTKLRADDTRHLLLGDVVNQAGGFLDKAKACTSAEALATEIIQPCLFQLESLVESRDSRRAMFFLAIDECGTIEPLLPHLRRLWNHAKPERTWIVLIDTNSSIAPIAGHTAIAASGRTGLHQGSHQLPPPFTSMPLDVHFSSHDSKTLAETLSAGTCSLRDLNLIICKLGRPLWNDANVYRYEDGMPMCNAIIAKLVKAPQRWQWPAMVPSDVVPSEVTQASTQGESFRRIMALVSQRVPLGQSSMSITQPWQTFVRDQVSNHLRFVERVHSYTDAVQSHVISEPALSMAAAWSFREDEASVSHKWSVAVAMLVAARTAIGLSIGLEGEEGVQVLCSMATDFAASNKHKHAYKKVEWNDSRVDFSGETIEVHGSYIASVGLITLDQWLTTLIGESIHAHAGEAAKAEFKAWSQRQWINFKHVADLAWQVNRAEEGMDRGLLAQAWIRHAAIRGVSNQPGWDLLIPTYQSTHRPDGTQSFRLGQLSYVAIQVKNTLSAPNFPKILGPDLAPVDDGSSPKFACLELFLDLRGPLVSAHSLIRTPHEEQGQASQQTRYNIYVSGLDEVSFPVLKKLSNDALEMAPILFGLDRLATNRFDHDFTAMVSQLNPPQLAEAERQLDMDAGKLPLIDGFPLVRRAGSSQMFNRHERGFAKGQSERMRSLGAR